MKSNTPVPPINRPPRRESLQDLFWAFLYRVVIVAFFALAGTVWVKGIFPKSWECSSKSAEANIRCRCSGFTTKEYSACPWKADVKCAEVTYCVGKITGKY